MKDAGLAPVFHPWKMQLAPNDPFPGQILPLGPPGLISAEDDIDHKAHKKLEVLTVVDYRKTKYSIQYKATYIGN